MQIGISLGINRMRPGGGAAAFDPDSLFAASEVGDWFDPSDLSKMWQDTAGTTAITADGQSVARIDGQLGVLSLQQATLGDRPLYKTSAGLHWLQFDGSSDILASSAALNMTGTDAVTVCAAVRKSSDTTTATFVELGPSANLNANTFCLKGPFANGANDYAGIFGGSNRVASDSADVYPSPDTAVITGLSDISADFLNVRRNGSVIASSASDQGTGNYANNTLYVGSRFGTQRFNGNIYFVLVRGALTSGVDLASLETFAGNKAGLSI
jgi:hypothetical protein